jgi:hypothetical protein
VSDAIYVYDSRQQYMEPVFVVYEEEHVDAVAQAIFGEGPRPDFLHVSYVRLHPSEKDRYASMGSTEFGRGPHVHAYRSPAKKR